MEESGREIGGKSAWEAGFVKEKGIVGSEFQPVQACAMHHGKDQNVISILLVQNDMTAMLMSADAISKDGSPSSHAWIRCQH